MIDCHGGLSSTAIGHVGGNTVFNECDTLLHADVTLDAEVSVFAALFKNVMSGFLIGAASSLFLVDLANNWDSLDSCCLIHIERSQV